MTAPITVVMTVYYPDGEIGAARAESGMKTLRSWVEFIRYPDLHLHIADDSPVPNTGFLRDLRRAVEYGAGKQWSAHVTYSRQPHQGVGASMNAGFGRAFDLSPLVLYAVDDWALTEPLNLIPWAILLLRDTRLGVVRMGPPHPDLTGTIKHIPEGWMLLLDRHHYAFATRPALYHQRMLDYYGEFAEHVDAYAVEAGYNNKFCLDAAGPDVAMYLPTVWEHTGTVEVSRVQPA